MENPASREDWLYYAGRDGLAFLRDVPVEDAAVLHVAERIGFVRETNYGRIFDVRASPSRTISFTPIAPAGPYRQSLS